MSGFWIKWTKGLARKPEVLQMAAVLSRSRHEIAGLLMELWEWADDNAEIAQDGASDFCPGVVRLPSSSAPLIDGLTGVPGFADAMVSAGWLAIRSSHIEFPNFTRHNGKPAKSRALDAERKRTTRAKPVPKMSGSQPDKNGTRAEQSRRDKNKTPQPPKGGRIAGENDPEFIAFWTAYPRKTKRQEAYKAWQKLKPDAALQATILSAIEQHKRTDQWMIRNVIPHPSSWLNGRRWEDEIDKADLPDAERAKQQRENSKRLSEEMKRREAKQEDQSDDDTFTF